MLIINLKTVKLAAKVRWTGAKIDPFSFSETIKAFFGHI